MVWEVIQNIRQGLKYRGGWRGLLEHIYANRDFPFKFGTYMGCDAAGNRYYENRVDYPFGQHRWVEPGNIHNFDPTSVDPEWHGWLHSTNDSPPSQEEAHIAKFAPSIIPLCRSDAPSDKLHLGHQNEHFNFGHLHNQTSVRSRGYNIGNPVVGLPPGQKDAYYTQPGSPYNEASLQRAPMVGDLGNGRLYKSDKWAERLRTPEERAARAEEVARDNAALLADMEQQKVQDEEAKDRKRRMARLRFGDATFAE